MGDTERRLDELERKLADIDSAFQVFRDVLIKIQNENVMLRKNRDFLIKKQKQLVKFPIQKDKLTKDIQEKLVEPLKNEFKEDSKLIKKLVSLKDDEKNKYKKSGTEHLDELFLMVMDNDSVTLKEAASHFNAHEYQVEEWAKILEDHGLIELIKNNGITELRKNQN
ncbi:hypothetical protein ACFLQN_04225 [Candidatus Aenigmatarchaeota archaeon]